jgi:hypothetical protein
VQFSGAVSPTERSALGDAGLNLLSYVGNHAYFAALRAPVDSNVLLKSRLTALNAIERQWKLHSDLLANQPPSWSIISPEKASPTTAVDPTVAVYVMFHKDVVLDPDGVVIVRRHGAWIRSKMESITGLVIELPLSEVAQLADEDAVMWIEPPLPQFSEVNDDNRTRTGAEVVQAAPYGLDGSGISVLVYDGGFALDSHSDFSGRLTVRDSAGLSDHATHVAGTVGGDGSASAGQFRGMAPAVTIESYGFEQPGGLSAGFLYTDPGDLEADYTEAINVHGVDLSNNSIGTNTAPNGFPCDWEGNYGATGALIDAIVGGSLGDPFRIVWANGNERQGAGACGTTYLTTAPPACAKNHITVGALNSDDDSVTSFTSWGPCDDGRIKPDLSGPGCQISVDGSVTSTSSAGGYTTKCGTSMAAPTITGLSALLLQDYRAQYPTEPDFLNSTLKSLLAHTAEDIENVGPDYMTGYGSVRIQPAIDTMRAGNFLEDVVDQGDTYSVLIIVGPADTELKVTLAWDDAPGTPNVDPVLVNDLDLVVIDSGNTTHFPWTLDPANPANPAVRTTTDHVNNIEQVVIDAPAPGTYRVEVSGFNIPTGPQSFSLVASPLLVACSSSGVVSLDRGKYDCTDTAALRVVDCDLNTDDTTIENASVTVFSTSEPSGETVILTESAPESAAFEGSVDLSSVNSPGVVHIIEGDQITITYLDADDGQGGTNVTIVSQAVVDCTPPVISNVAAPSPEPRQATITFDTNEPASSTVHYGLSCGNLDDSVTKAGLNISHSVTVGALSDDTTYFYSVEAADEVGHVASNDNGGTCYFFTTPEVPDFFTEEYGGDNDLDNTSIMLTPNGSVDFYSACSEPITVLPTAPGGMALVMSDDDSQQVTLSTGATVSIYGASYASFFVGSNGYITFDGGDIDWSESLSEHFAVPRISALYDDFNPSVAGSVLWEQFGDRVVVSYVAVPEYNTSNSSTFQVEMFFNGDITVSYLDMAPTDGIAGLSGGAGLDPDFFDFDLGSAGVCGPRPPAATSRVLAAAPDTAVEFDLQATDDGQPDPPGALTLHIITLPEGTIEDTTANHVITAPDLPYMMSGTLVTYTPNLGFGGSDTFQFIANDGGVPPEGGDSNVATIAVDVLELLALPFFDDFPTTTFDTEKWASVTGAEIDTVGLSEPSGPNAARLNGDPGGNDEFVTAEINLSTEDTVRLTYYFQQTGGGESPDSGDDLFVEYVDASGTWHILQQHVGSDGDMSTFQAEDILLPPGALHSLFRLRFRCTATAGLFDDWFVDNVGVTVANAPVANNLAVTTPESTPFDISLDATDPNEDTLAYTILSLPSNGVLSDPGTGAIGSAPHVLAANGNVVHYSPAPLNFQGNDAFTYIADDGEHDSNIATVDVTVGGPQPVYQFLVDDQDPGWVGIGQWEFGVPTGGGGSNGNDPTSGFTGSNVLGYNLAGDYPNNMGLEFLTTDAIDCSTVVSTELRFQRWLGVESSSFDHASVEVSADGNNWAPVWDHSGPSFNDAAWIEQVFDISAIADEEPQVFIRWTMGTTDGSVTYPGWNLDDIEIWGITTLNCYGDLDGDGAADLDDIMCVADGFAGTPCAGGDIFPCSIDGSINLDDLLAVIDAFRGSPACTATCD